MSGFAGHPAPISGGRKILLTTTPSAFGIHPFASEGDLIAPIISCKKSNGIATPRINCSISRKAGGEVGVCQ
ncbi:MAG: hypothetical protein LBB23_04455 [Rickettsiales bacterium]|nr:hypothetical protein [Rickettsiales bacterium]